MKCQTSQSFAGTSCSCCCSWAKNFRSLMCVQWIIMLGRRSKSAPAGCLRIAWVWGEALESQVKEGWKVEVETKSCSSGFCWVWHHRAEWQAAATAFQFLPVLWKAFQHKKDWGIFPELANSVTRTAVNRNHNEVAEQLHLRWRKCLGE